MNANLKAIELTEKYFRLLFINISDHEQIVYPKDCKACALIAVDEILNMDSGEVHYKDYWKEVRKEINKL